MSEESTNHPSHPFIPLSPPQSSHHPYIITPSPSLSPNFGRFHQFEAQQRHLQEHRNDLAAQMATFIGQTALPLGLEA